MRCAVCQISDGVVINIIVADPSDEPPSACALIKISDQEICGVGWTWNGNAFYPPAWWLETGSNDLDLAIELPHVSD